jgi:hypothetical protein
MNQEIPLSGGDNITNVVDAQWGIAADIGIEASVTEVLSSFIDTSAIKLPASWTDKQSVSTTWTDKV